MRLGTDPEVFLVDKTGLFHSVIGHIGADKWNPLQLSGMAPGFTLQEDNVALEFGIPPAASADEFVAHIKAVMEKGLSKVKGYSFSKLSCAVFPDKELEHPMARVFGCEPDYNAWTGKENPRPHCDNPNLRSAGGHVHVETGLDRNLVIQAMDLFLGVPSVLMDSGEDRRKLYGAAGSCRYKPYGVEYRTLSNFWIFDDKLIKWVWNNTESALEFAETMGKDVLPTFKEDILKSINKGCKKTAEKLVKECNLEVV